jgi:transposase
MQNPFHIFVGVDWGTENHCVCVLDREGNKIAERRVPHSGSGLQQLLIWLKQQTGVPAEQVAVAIEMPTGAIVEMLVEHNYPAFAINPKQLDRFRDRYSVAGAKDDSRDAFVLADSLRTDLHCFHSIQLKDPQIIRIRTLSRLHHDLQQDWSRLTNQLLQQIHRYYPQMLELSPAADDSWMWDLLECAPLPAQIGRLTLARVEKILARHRIRRFSAEQVLEQLRTVPLPVAAGTAEAASEAGLLLIARLRLLDAQTKDVNRRIAELLLQLQTDPERPEHRDVQLLCSVVGVGQVVAATMLAEAYQPLIQRDYHALRSYAGAAPVTWQSGKKKQVIMRYGCNQPLRQALYHWARVSLQKDARSRAHYHRLRQNGHSHGRALRGVADRLLAMLISMLKHQTLYDPARRGMSARSAA